MPGTPHGATGLVPLQIREELRALYPRVEKGRGGVVTLLGGAESGKSRLVADLVREANERGWTSLLATATPRSNELPRGLVLDALRPILPGAVSPKGPPADRALRPPGLGLPLALAAFLPKAQIEEAQGPAPADRTYSAPWELPSSLSPMEAETLLLRRLWEAAVQTPIVLLLDDAQWMDDLSVRFVSTLSLAIQGHRVLLVLALDPEAAPPLVRRFSSQAEGGFSEKVYRVAPTSSHKPRPLPPRAPLAPETVEPSLLETLLSLGAVVGIEFDVRTLAATTGRPAAEIQASLEDGARRGWLWKSGEESFHFSGERTWRWASDMPYEPLSDRHERVARALEALHPVPAGRELFELAHHWMEAGKPDRAFPYLVSSAEAAYGSGAFELARDRLQRARGMLPSLPPARRPHEEVRVLVDLAEVRDAMGDGTAAAARLREALGRAEGAHLPVREVVRIEVLLGDLQRRWGRGDLAFDILERARAKASSAHDPATEATVLSRMAMVLRRQGHWAEARADVERSLQLLAEGGGGPEERALVHFAAADTYIWGGREDDAAAREHIRETRRAVQELGQLSREVALINLEGLHASQLGDPEEALRLWERAADAAVQSGNILEATNMHGNLAEVFAERRRFNDARTSIAFALELLQGTDEPRIRGQIHLAAATLAWRQGKADEAEQELDRGMQVLSSDASVDLRQQLEFLRARIRLSQGRRAEARKLVEALDPLRYPQLLPPEQRPEWEQMQSGGSSPA